MAVSPQKTASIWRIRAARCAFTGLATGACALAGQAAVLLTGEVLSPDYSEAPVLALFDAASIATVTVVPLVVASSMLFAYRRHPGGLEVGMGQFGLLATQLGALVLAQYFSGLAAWPGLESGLWVYFVLAACAAQFVWMLVETARAIAGDHTARVWSWALGACWLCVLMAVAITAAYASIGMTDAFGLLIAPGFSLAFGVVAAFLPVSRARAGDINVAAAG